MVVGEGYENLPAYVFRPDPAAADTTTFYTRWQLSPIERLRVAWTGEMGMYQVTGGRDFQPQLLDTKRPWIQPGVIFAVKLWWNAFGMNCLKPFFERRNT